MASAFALEHRALGGIELAFDLARNAGLDQACSADRSDVHPWDGRAPY